MPKQDAAFEDMTLGELHDAAKEHGLSGTSHMKKDELIEALRAGGSKDSAKDDSAKDDSTDRTRDDKGHFEKSDAKASDSKSAGSTKTEDAGKYDDMTLAELHDEAKEKGLTGTSHMKKDELIEALSGKSDAKGDTKGDASGSDGRKRDEKGHFESDDTKGDKEKVPAKH